MAKRDYYDVLGVGGARRTRSSRRPIASSRSSTTRTAIPTIPRPRRSSRRRRRPTPCSPTRRSGAAYDRFGFEGVGAGGPGGFPGGDFAAFGDLFDDLFGDLFGGARGGRRGGRGQRGADLRYTHEIELREVLVGVETLDLDPAHDALRDVHGSGARPGTEPETCPRCGGSGQTIFQQGLFRISRPCDACGGEGRVVRDPCKSCRGTGRTEGERSVKVRIPPGVEDGMRLRVAGEGEAGIAGGPPGDLYVVIRVSPHPLFEREGADLICEVPVSFVQAALGAEIEVPTLEGKVVLRISEGTQSGKVLRLRGQGPPERGRQRAATSW